MLISKQGKWWVKCWKLGCIFTFTCSFISLFIYLFIYFHENFVAFAQRTWLNPQYTLSIRNGRIALYKKNPYQKVRIEELDDHFFPLFSPTFFDIFQLVQGSLNSWSVKYSGSGLSWNECISFFVSLPQWNFPEVEEWDSALSTTTTTLTNQ